MKGEEEKIFKPFIFANQDMRSKNEKEQKRYDFMNCLIVRVNVLVKSHI